MSRIWHVFRYGIAPLLAMLAGAAGMSGSALAVVPGTAWEVSFTPQPTNLPLTGGGFGEPSDQYVLVLTNIGGVASNGPIALTDTLPAGVTAAAGSHGPGWGCSAQSGPPSLVTCSYGGSVPALGQSLVLVIPVAVATAGTLVNQVKVEGGGAPTVTASGSTQAGPTDPPFGFLDFSSKASNISGVADTAAGAHPYALTTTFDLPLPEHLISGARKIPKAMEIDLPPGLSGNPQAATRCPIIDVFAETCPASSRVGTIMANYSLGLLEEVAQIYNVVPERGFPAEFGVNFNTIQKSAFIYANVGVPPTYALHVSIPDIPQPAEARNVIATFFGDPQRMDGGVNSSTPFLTNPSSCSGEPLLTRTEADTWEEPERWVSAVGQAPPVSGCDLLQFAPALKVAPNVPVADEPTAYNVDLQVPQSQSSGLEGLATPDVKNATVTLPQGVSLSPGAGDGLAGCPAEGSEGINLSSNEAGHCPLASQVGTAEAHTPLLEQPLEGHVYVALPGCGGEHHAACTEADVANGTLFSLYLELEGSGVVIKQHGVASVNPATGQLTTRFRNAPQQPFDDLQIHLKDGPRAPLANPQTCGSALTTSDITPWSSPQTPDATPSSAFTVTGCGEVWPFSLSFEAGSVNPAAGAYTSFTTTLGRTDRQQDISTVQAHLPVGLLASISHVTLCGEPQAERGECPADSRIATVTAAVGAGSHPLTVSGPAYLTGPYNGAPFGLSLVIPAKAGPFNLGTVVTRGMLNIDPATAAVTVTTNPLVQIVDGVPVRLQTANVLVDHQQFMFNPTNCEAKQVTATVVSAQNATAQVSSRFAAGGCKNLPFNPGFKVATRSPGSKKKGTSLDVRVSSEPGQANIHSVSVSLPKQLPSRLTTIQQACPEATYAQNPATCPPGSLVGVAKGTTPILSVPIAGPAYLVSHGGAAFPDIKVILQAEGVRIDLTGSINIKKQITSSTFASIPDAPIASFDLNFPAGPHSALTTNGSLCAKPLIMPTTIVGQNGRRLVRSTKVSVAGCPVKTGLRPAKKKKRGK